MTDGELDEAAQWLDRLTHDRTEHGTVTVRAVNDHAARPRYQTCRIAASIASPTLGVVDAGLECVVRRDAWPTVGEVLPATVHVDRPERSEIDWELVLARRRGGRSGG